MLNVQDLWKPGFHKTRLAKLRNKPFQMLNLDAHPKVVGDFLIVDSVCENGRTAKVFRLNER